MKIKLEMEITKKDMEDVKLTDDVSKEEFLEELKQRMFEVCEDWVLRGQEPDMEVEDERKSWNRDI